MSRRFHLQRDVDVSGISGTGAVAEGVAFSDGTVAIRWLAGDHHSTVVWDSIESVEHIHGHGGVTRIVWHDDEAHHVSAEPDGEGGWVHTCQVCGATGSEPPPMPCPGPS